MLSTPTTHFFVYPLSLLPYHSSLLTPPFSLPCTLPPLPLFPISTHCSWNPRGALAAGRAPAVYLASGRTVEVPGDALFSSARPLRLPSLPALALEWVPNRDSLKYARLYCIGRDTHSDTYSDTCSDTHSGTYNDMRSDTHRSDTHGGTCSEACSSSGSHRDKKRDCLTSSGREGGGACATARAPPGGGLSVCRGTLRYQGFGSTMAALAALGYFSPEPCPLLAYPHPPGGDPPRSAPSPSPSPGQGSAPSLPTSPSASASGCSYATLLAWLLQLQREGQGRGKGEAEENGGGHRVWGGVEREVEGGGERESEGGSAGGAAVGGGERGLLQAAGEVLRSKGVGPEAVKEAIACMR